MNISLKAGFASAALLVATVFAAPASAGGFDGSTKDAYMPPLVRQAAGPCYFRGDVGYSWSRNPEMKWPGADNGDPATGNYVEGVSNVSMENTWFLEGGLGCGQGSRGWRGELMLGYRGKRDLDGMPEAYSVTYPDDPLHTSVTSYTIMANLYRDLGNWGGVVPYLGAGIGIAYHQMGQVSFTENPALNNRYIEGNSDVSLAWSLMAGIGYQLSERAILDVGYRYINMGRIQSGRVDNCNCVYSPVRADDLAAHEFKVGLRYHFGGDAAPMHAPFK